MQCSDVHVAVKRLECSLLQSEQQETEKSKNELLHAAKDVLSDWLDSLYRHTVSDLAVFDRLAKKLALFSLFNVLEKCFEQKKKMNYYPI